MELTAQFRAKLTLTLPQGEHQYTALILSENIIFIHSSIFFIYARILNSLEQFASTLSLPENSTNSPVVFARDNFAILVQSINQTDFEGQMFSVSIDGDLSQDDLVTAQDAPTNSNVSVDIPPSAFEITDDCSPSDRIFYAVFTTNTLFLTPDTNCDKFAIGSVIITVEVNGCSDLAEAIELDFQELDQVSARRSIRETLCGHSYLACGTQIHNHMASQQLSNIVVVFIYLSEGV